MGRGQFEPGVNGLIKSQKKQLRSRYDQFISSVPICCCGIESVGSKVVSFESSFDQNQRVVHREK